MQNREDLVSRIISEKDSFPPSIDYIRFPYFRNLEANTKINFSSSFTVFVGQNGCGKSSVLQALYGAPDKCSLGDYWFTTVMDPISEPTSEEHRHCFIYSHSKLGEEKEVLKRRIFKDKKPDLWDTSEAMARYGMHSTGKRTSSPIKKNVVYINFRTAQNSFEKRFHEERPPQPGVQNHLRKRSKCLSLAFNGTFVDYRYKDIPYSKIQDFTDRQLHEVKEILGRNYKEAKLIKHRFFDIMGDSILISTENAKYSEAFAGSGEFAVFLLVSEISKAPEGSLLLLDEPETSLHPGAQRNLQLYLLKQCVEKKLQVVICSHSPSLIEGLPEESIKVFYRNEKSKFSILENVTPHEAFHFIGESNKENPTVHVEDSIAKSILLEVANDAYPMQKMPFEVAYFPGGKNRLMQDAEMYSRNHKSENFIIFDSDVNPGINFSDPIKTIGSDYNDAKKSVKALDKILSDLKFEGIKFPVDSNSINTFQKRDAMIKYIEYANKNIFYFPEEHEEMIWDISTASKYLELSAQNIKISDLAKLPAKLRYVELARLSASDPTKPSAEEIKCVHNIFVRNWVSLKDKSYNDIISTINVIRTRVS